MSSSANINIENDDKYCFNWSVVGKIHPCNSNHANRVSNYRQYFIEINIEGFHFTNGFKCSDVGKFEKGNKLSINVLEINFHQDHSKRRHKIIPIEVIKNETDRVIDLIIYKNHFVRIKKLHLFFGNQNCKYVCRRSLNSYTSQNLLIEQKQECGEEI